MSHMIGQVNVYYPADKSNFGATCYILKNLKVGENTKLGIIISKFSLCFGIVRN